MGDLGKDRKTGFVRTWWSHSKSCCIVSDGEHWKSVRSQGNILNFWYKVSTFSCKLASSCRITYNLENLSCQKRALGYQVREGQGILLRSFKSWRLFSIILQSAIIYLITRLIDWVIVVFEIDPSSPAAAVELEIRKKLHISFDFARGYLYLRLTLSRQFLLKKCTYTYRTYQRPNLHSFGWGFLFLDSLRAIQTSECPQTEKRKLMI